MKFAIHSGVVAAMLVFAPAWPAVVQAQDAAAVRAMAATCANCHGTDGHSVGAVPALAGVDRAYMVRQMQEFKSGKRPATVMQQLAKGLNDAQIESVAAYFAAQKN